MEKAYQELLVARISSGTIRLRMPDGNVFIVKAPSSEDIYIANEIYQDVWQESNVLGAYDDDELLMFLLDNGFWDEERQQLLDSLPGEIEQFKLSLFKSAFKSKEKKQIRLYLAKAKEKLLELLNERHQYDSISCSGCAALAKSRYIFAVSLYDTSGNRVICDLDEPVDSWFEDAMSLYASSKLDEQTLRELARSETWRPIWNLHKTEGTLFGKSPIEYTDEQLALTSWSSLYDGIYQHPDCPSDDVINDDDVLDGWMIDQRKQREERQMKAEAGGIIGNEKIKNAQEVYLVADTTHDAKKIMDLNDAYGKAVQKQRFKTLKEKGIVNEMEMPDTKQRLRMEVTRKLSEALKGGG